VAKINASEPKLLALVDSNILVYALIKDYPDKERHETCLTLLDRGLRGQLDYCLAVNSTIIAEVFTVLKEMINKEAAEVRMTTMLNSRHVAYIQISKKACQNAVEWATKYNVPVNDALIAASAAEHAPTIYTNDEEHFKKLQTHNLTIINPTTMPWIQ
jgi:predicted nucleic acid-binding protein